MNTERTWEISDLDGSNKRTVTLAQYRAELDARKVYTARIAAAVQTGNMKAVIAAQRAMRDAFRN
jgi:hypothetical protein